MRKLIADSGSTKAAWRFIDDAGHLKEFQTLGMNPFFRTTDDMFQELQDVIYPEIGAAVDEIFFYGAGVTTQEKGQVVKDALLRLFPKAKVETNSDVLAAARALFGNQAGIACILGTGSNACLYDGEKIAEGVPPLGFILGDECSGGVLGRKLLGDYFKKVMPAELRALFEKQYAPQQSEVLERVYRAERPNRYLAGFVPFLSQNISHPYSRDLVRNSMVEFFDRNVLKLPDALCYKLGFIGSVAFYFSEIVEELARDYGFKKYLILKEPIERLVEYHTQSTK